MADAVVCATCIYWCHLPALSRPNLRFGQCRRRSPRVDAKLGPWPYTTEDAWCGEHVWNEYAIREAVETR